MRTLGRILVHATGNFLTAFRSRGIAFRRATELGSALDTATPCRLQIGRAAGPRAATDFKQRNFYAPVEKFGQTVEAKRSRATRCPDARNVRLLRSRASFSGKKIERPRLPRRSHSPRF